MTNCPQPAAAPAETNEWIEQAKGTLLHLAAFLERTGAPHRTDWRDWIDSAEAHITARHQAAPAATERPETPIYSFDVLPPDIEKRLAPWLTLGKDLHPHTVNLVVRFSRALAAKLADAEKKYGYSDGWLSPDWMDECRVNLMEHVLKGDPRDVAAYCAFLWHHGESTTPSSAVQAAPVVQETGK
jgi:hypothetical protein